VGVHHSRFSCAALASKVLEGLPVYADIIRRPHPPQVGFDSARDLALQALEGIEDEPRQKVLIKLREWHFPWPYGRSTMGREEELEKLTLDLCKLHQSRSYQPRGSILAIAGNIEFDQVRAEMERWFGDWSGAEQRSSEIIPP